MTKPETTQAPPPGVIGWTLDRFVIERQREQPQATGELTGLFQQVALAGKIVGSSRVDLQACKLEYSIVSPK